MTSHFAGHWKLYGCDNADLLLDGLMLPKPIKCAMKNVPITEDVHVNGDNVHVNIHVPTYSIPAHSKEINFTFGVEHTQSLPLGRSGKGISHKESENKWVAKLALDGCSCIITREIRNGEMWVTMESQNTKTVRKFERCKHDTASESSTCKTACSPFQGSWRLYGSDNFDHFMETAGVPAFWRNLLAHANVWETIHVNGEDVHIKICMEEIIVPSHCVQSSFKFNEPHEVTMPFGHKFTATVQKLSDSKWHAKVSCKSLGDATFTREIINNETWATLEAKGKRVVFKFSRLNSPSCA